MLGGTFDRQTTIGYEASKRIVTDPKSNVTYKYIDVRGNLRQITDPSPGGSSYYDYDHFGNLVSTTDATGVVSGATYNLRGFKIGSNDPDAGAWTYALNSLGEIVSQVDAKSQTATLSYDKLSRITSRVEAEGTSNWTWGNSASLKNINKLQSVSGPGYSESYSYDSTGRPSSTSYSADTTYTVDYVYNTSTGFLDNITYPASTSGYRLRVQYQYQYGILNQIRDYNAPSTVWWQLNAADALGNPIDEQFGNGVHALSNNDDLTGHLNWRVSGNTSPYTNHQNVGFYWDKNENLQKRVDLNQSSLTEEFFYDALDRLDYSKLSGTTNLDVTLDAGGNITNKSDVGSFNYTTAQSGCSYYTHTQPHAVRNAGGVIYCYDQNGNMTKRNGATTSWYSYNLPNSVSDGTYSSTFYYGPNRNRWKQVATYSGGSENTIYIGGLMEKVTVAAGTLYRHYIPAGSNSVVLARWSTGANETYYVTGDHLGSSSVITNSAGTALVKESFGAYGARRGSTWTGLPSAGDKLAIASATREGFTGHEHIDNLNLIHMNGRVYDPVIGRFTSSDPYIDWDAGSQGLNRYGYVSNRALSAIDPSGFDGIFIPRGLLLDHGSMTVIGSGSGNISISGNAGASLSGGYSSGLSGRDTRGYAPPSTPDEITVTRTHVRPPSLEALIFSIFGIPTADAFAADGITVSAQRRKPSKCVNYPQLGAGALATGLGLLQSTAGLGEVSIGLALTPETFGAGLLLTGRGAVDVGLGSVAMIDGLSLMQTAFDGVQRDSTFGGIGNYIGGENGRFAGEMVNAGLGLKGFSGLIRNGRAGNSGLAMNFLNAVASSVMPESMRPCQ